MKIEYVCSASSAADRILFPDACIQLCGTRVFSLMDHRFGILDFTTD